MKYRKKPVVIEAIKWDGNESTFEKIKDPKFNSLNRSVIFLRDGTLSIDTLEGVHKAIMGDFIIRGVKGEIYPCKADVFKMTYEKV